MSTKALLAARLEKWSEPNGALDHQGPNSSANRFASDSRRDLVLEEICDEYLSRQADVGHDSRCAVVTAGPPGAGKSTLVNELDPGYRRIDPDIIKDILLNRALTDGTYDALLAVRLADAEPLHPRELSGLVHAESTVVANDVMTVAVGRRENVVVEGTLSWEPLVAQLIEIFDDHDYRELSILSCDVPEAIAQARAQERWWRDRQRLADGLGGRFVPPRVITALYPKTVDSSQCRANAEEMFARARGVFPEVLLKTLDLTGTNTQRHSASRYSP